MLYVEHRWQVSLLQMHVGQEPVCLFSGAALVAPKMIGPPDKSGLTCLIEVIGKVLVELAGAFRGLYNNESQRATAHHGVAQLVPVYLSLIVADVDAVYLVARGIFGIAVDSSPSKACRAYKVDVERPYV